MTAVKSSYVFNVKNIKPLSPLKNSKNTVKKNLQSVQANKKIGEKTNVIRPLYKFTTKTSNQPTDEDWLKEKLTNHNFEKLSK